MTAGFQELSELPEQGIIIDLDRLERDPAQAAIVPFKFVIGGRTITMIDPETLDWQDLLSMEDPTEFLRLAITEDDRRYLRTQAIPGWKFNGLMESYMDHYKMKERIDEAERRGGRKSFL